ncbi:MAG TPA: hypothetical protein VFP66_16355 [Candidatus Limnocylindrales bacterium]|nr:hypothetical protein [Candidatus Limnocylindrales bacterium]
MLLQTRGEVLKKSAAYTTTVGRQPTQPEFASSIGVSKKALDNALRRLNLPWPPDGTGQG